LIDRAESCDRLVSFEDSSHPSFLLLYYLFI
jgi:hypothetical protein